MRVTSWPIAVIALGLITPAAAEDAPRPITLRPFMGISALELDIGRGDVATYQPNSPMKLGLAASYDGWGGSLSLAVETTEPKETHGETQALDFSLYGFGDRWGWDVFFQRYKGLYQSDTSDERETRPERAPEAQVRRVGATAYYALDSRFSPAMVFKQSRRPKGSVGSWLLLGGLDYGDFGLRGAPQIQLSGASLGGGWGQLWISEGGWYFAPLIMMGVGVGAQSSGAELTDITGEDGARALLKGNIKLSLGQRGPRVYWGLSVLTDSFTLLDDDDSSLEWRSLYAEWFFGLRI